MKARPKEGHSELWEWIKYADEQEAEIKELKSLVQWLRYFHEETKSIELSSKDYARVKQALKK